MTDKILAKLSEKYPTSELSVGEFSRLKASGMTFSVKAYFAEGLGQVSVMRAKGFFGLMKMDTLIINPTSVDLPLYSYDRIFAMGNDTLIVELYDTLSGEYDESALLKAKAKFASLPERDAGEHWYDSIKLSSSISKKGKKDTSAAFDELTLEHLDAYLASVGGVADESEKMRKAKIYVDGLLEKGGPSTDVFKKNLGEEKTKELFYKVLFGIK